MEEQRRRSASGPAGGGRQQSSQTRFILWLAVGIVSPLVYALVAYILATTGYEAPFSGSLGWEMALLVLGLVQLAAAYVVRNRVRALPLGDPKYIVALAFAELIGIEGLLAYLLLGASTVTVALIVYALTAALLFRPTEMPWSKPPTHKGPWT